MKNSTLSTFLGEIGNSLHVFVVLGLQMLIMHAYGANVLALTDVSQQSTGQF